MPKKYRCEICNKELDRGNVCDSCSEEINGFIKSIKERLKEVRKKREEQEK